MLTGLSQAWALAPSSIVWGIATTCIVPLAVIGLVAVRNRLQIRSQQLNLGYRKYEETVISLKSAQRERLRLAGDLHDGVQQLLLAADIHLEAAQVAQLSIEQMTEKISSARKALKRTQEELRRAIWGIQEIAEGETDFVTILKESVAALPQWPAGALTIHDCGVPYELPSQVAGSLLLLVREAVGNAFSHGAASEVNVTIIFGSDELRLIISDNGSGFDPTTAAGPLHGHFGINGMKRRASWLGGKLKLHSTKGVGTELTLTLPRTPDPLAIDNLS